METATKNNINEHLHRVVLVPASKKSPSLYGSSFGEGFFTLLTTII